LLSFFFLSLVVADLLLPLLLYLKVDGVSDELTVLLDDLFDATILQVLILIFLEVENNLCTTWEFFSTFVTSDSERTACR
uniref:Uncharacterized protein n=1 Tax=Amphimedon queenslandica TaxID=400682 RepID=A0A1X7VAP7_AMPQE